MMLAAAPGGPAAGSGGQAESGGSGGGRFSVLTWEQVQRLDQILGEAVPIHGRGNFPTLSVRPRTIVQVRTGDPPHTPGPGEHRGVMGSRWWGGLSTPHIGRDPSLNPPVPVGTPPRDWGSAGIRWGQGGGGGWDHPVTPPVPTGTPLE